MRKTQDIGLDVVVFADDVAFNTAPMVSPGIFQQHFACLR